MRDLYQRILDGGEAAIEQLKSDRVQENVELDFKTKTHPNKVGLTKEDRQNLGEALSALSNSIGGLLIWGVIARKNVDGIDCVCDLDPIDYIESFKSEVERAVSQVLMPRHDGIQISMITCSSAPKSGYLIIKVERSERRPHRCEAPGAKNYFKRVGDSNIAMEHYDIEDSFRRVVVPSLTVEYSLSDGGRQGGPSGDYATLLIALHLKNCSQVSARYPYLIIDKLPPRMRQLPFSLRDVPRFNGGSDDVIHPDLEMKVLDLQYELRVISAHRSGDYYLAIQTQPSTTLIHFRCGCLHTRPTSGTIQIPREEIARTLPVTIA
jgi:hypothetical protein